MLKKESHFVLLILLFTLFLTGSGYGQFNDYSIKGGIQGFGLLPETDFANNDLKLSYLGRGFLRINLIDLADLEIGVGYGLLSGEDPSNTLWETSIIPADVRILISPFELKTINPYIYGGAGIIKWDINKKPNQDIWLSPYSDVEEDGIDLNIPIGLGLEIKLTEALLLDLSGGYNYVLTDDLNYYNNIDIPGDGGYDGFWNAGLGLVFTGESGSSDSDRDGLTLDQEAQIGTDPDLPDTDFDGLIDGLEFHQYKTDPLLKDSDGDGLNDNDEIKHYTTDPNKNDSDKDNISDGDEINVYHTDPLRTDSDFDGIPDYDEINVTLTLPNKADTDKDGLKDGDEIEKYKTSPNKSDSDGDGISDGDEVLKFNTNPTKQDTDGGSVNDDVEIKRGSNPLNPEDDIILDVTSPIILEGITFNTGSSTLSPESETILKRVLVTLNVYPKMKVEIRGYTDNVGKSSSNLRLSQRRADAVRIWLLNKGINENRIKATGYGEQNPIADNKTAEGRKKNRRIEFIKVD